MATVFTIVESTDAFIHVAIQGDLDSNGARAIEAQFTASTSGIHRPIIVDLSRVAFISSVGLFMLFHVAREAALEQHATVLLGANEIVAGAIRVTRLDAVMPLVRDLAHALELVKSPPPSTSRSG